MEQTNLIARNNWEWISVYIYCFAPIVKTWNRAHVSDFTLHPFILDFVRHVSALYNNQITSLPSDLFSTTLQLQYLWVRALLTWVYMLYLISKLKDIFYAYLFHLPSSPLRISFNQQGTNWQSNYLPSRANFFSYFADSIPVSMHWSYFIILYPIKDGSSFPIIINKKQNVPSPSFVFLFVSCRLTA